MSDIQSGETFVDGQTVNAARLNNDLASAVILPTFVTAKAATSAVGADSIVFVRASDGLLYKTTVGQLAALGGVTSVGLTAPTGFTVAGSPVMSAGTIGLGLSAQSGNKLLASPADGTSGTPAFRAQLPNDVNFPSVLIAAANVDWSLSDKFYKTLSANITFTFSNITKGRGVIRCAITQSGSWLPLWPGTVKWPNGSEPIQHAGLGVTAIWTFTYINGITYGDISDNNS